MTALITCATGAAAATLGATTVSSHVDSRTPVRGSRVPEGYSIGNFGIAAAISADGLRILKGLFNPPELGNWLQPFGTGQLILRAAGTEDFQVKSHHSEFPENSATLRSLGTGIEAQVNSYAPLRGERAAGDSFNNFIPAVVVEVTLSNPGQQVQDLALSYRLDADEGISPVQSETLSYLGASILDQHRKAGPAEVWMMVVPDARRGVASWSTTASVPAAPTGMGVDASIRIKPRQSRSVSFVFGVYDPRGYPATLLHSRRALENYLLTQGLQAQPGGLRQQNADFVAALPRTGDAQIDEYARWYLSAAVLLTKGISSGNVLTMGYAQLNQRDSFWTTGAHLIYWPDLELKMLRESMAAQGPNGQIPLCILPIIDRENNIDGNEYFVLRVARYYRWYRDKAFLKEVLPHVKRAIDYLIARDQDHIGLPKQVSFWADWKDVSGVEGRTYAPHFDLLWLAALKSAQLLAHDALDLGFEVRLSALYKTADRRINREVAKGGLWDHSHYVDLWQDHRSSPYVLEDQAVAAVFDVIARERLDRIYTVLNSSNESPFGVRETYPYVASVKEDFGPGPAEYHNGGVWPWLNFADAWGRFKNGHAADAERILKKVGYGDLVRFNDFAPGEYLHGETGENKGFAIQGWDADFFSAIYFGAFGLERLDAKRLAVHVNLSPGHDFTTVVRAPEGDLIMKRVNDFVSVDASRARPLQIEILK